MPDFWRFPTVSMGIGPLNAIYQARFMSYLENRGLIEKTAAQGLGLRRRRRDRRGRHPRRHLARRTREARQPDLRRQLQPAAARRPGARQQAHHRRARRRLPRRRLERHQGHLGLGLGRALRARPHRPAAEAHGRVRRRRLPDLQGQGRRLPAPGVLRQVSRAARTGQGHDRRRSSPTCIAAATIRPRSTTPTSAPPSTRAARRSSSPRRSRATASAPRRRATPRTRRRSSPTTRSPPSSSASTSPFRRRPPKNGAFYRPAQDTPEIVYMQERRKELGGYMPTRKPPAARLQGARRSTSSTSGWPARRAAPSRPRWASSASCAPAEGSRDRQADRAHRPR